MKVKVVTPFPVSLDEGLTVTTFPPGEHDMPAWAGRVAIKYYGAKEIKPKSAAKRKKT